MVWGWPYPRPSAAPEPPAEATLESLENVGNRLVWKGTDRAFTGRLVARDANGVLRSASTLVEGRLHGLSEGWFTNGVLQIREPFVDGVAQGVRTKWRSDGSKESEASIRDGQIDGRFVRWNPQGGLTEEACFQAGIPIGEARAWHPDGSLSSWCRLEQGKVMESKTWPPGECLQWPVSVAKAP
jgi:antitoxin component YwqK of YwqJK toxin-antitoxin module